MIEASSPSRQIRRVYDLWSFGYDFIAGPFERAATTAGLAKAALQPHETVLEVAVGAGNAFLDICARAGPESIDCGVDISPKMLAKTRRRLQRAGFTNAALFEANARQLPFADKTFDCAFNAYMLDLIRLAELPIVLSEFFRVLKPGGRLVLVNFSKATTDERTWWERLYQSLPRSCAAYLLGGCRPVVVRSLVEQTGFVEIERDFRPNQFLPTEIVTARRPDA